MIDLAEAGEHSLESSHQEYMEREEQWQIKDSATGIVTNILYLYIL